MSGSNTLGGTVKLDGESEYRKALSNITTQMKLMSSEMMKVTAEYGKNDDSIEGLTARNKVLANQIDIQTERVNTLRGALEQSINQYGEADKKTLSWQISLNRAEAELTKLNKELAENQEVMSQSGDSSNDSSKGLKEFGDEAKNSEQKVLSLGDVVKANLISEAIIGGIRSLGSAIKNVSGSVTNLIGEMREYNTDLDKLEANTVSNNNDFDLMKEKMQGLVAITGETDSSIEALSNLMATGLDDSQMEAAVSGLSGAIIKFPDTLKIESLADSLQETIATGSATGQFSELIGRMGGNVDEFNKGLANCSSEVEKQNYALQWLSESGLADINAEYQEANKGAISLSVAEQKLTDVKARLADNLTNTLGPALASSKTAIADFGQSMVTAYGALFYGDVEGGAKMVADSFINLANDLSSILPQMLTVGTNLIQGLLQGIQQALPTMMPIITDAILSLAEFILENLPLILDTGIQIILALIQGISESLPELIPTILTAILDMVDTLLSNIDLIIDAGIQLTLGLAQGLINAIPQLIERLPEIIDQLIMGLTTNLPKLTAMGVQLTIQLGVGLVKAIPQLISKIPQIIASIVKGFANYISQVWSIGTDMVKGIWQGISNGFDWIKKKIKEWVGNVLDFFKELLGIHSPSTVFRDQIGSNMALGIDDGFSKEMVSVRNNMAKAIPTDFETKINTKVNYEQSDLDQIRNNQNQNINESDNQSPETNQNGGDNYQIVINNNSRYTSPSENARLMKRSLQLMKLKAGKG